MKSFVCMKMASIALLLHLGTVSYCLANQESNKAVTASLVPSALVTYGFITTCQQASKQLELESAKDIVRNDSFFSVIRSLLALVGEVQRTSTDKNILISKPVVEEFMSKLALVMITLRELDADGLLVQSLHLTKNTMHDRQQEIVELLKTAQGPEYVQVFFKNLQQYLQHEMASLVTMLDKTLSVEQAKNKTLFGLFTVPQLPNVEDVAEHQVTLLSTVVEAWNFFSIFMNHDSKQEYLTEQVGILIDYLKEQIVQVVQQSFDPHDYAQAVGGIHVVININL